MLYGVTAIEMLTYAGRDRQLRPGRRASRIDPADALRTK